MPKTPSEHSFGPPSSIIKQANEFLEAHSLGVLLPYLSYDTDSQLFFNRASVGFVIETLPLVGCDDEIPRQITGIFQHSLPLGSNLQCLLIASGRIGPRLKTWEAMRGTQSEVLQELAGERCTYLENLAQGQGLRTFRLLISYSQPESSIESLETILAFRDQLVTTLMGWGLPIKVWQAEDMLCGLDELLNPSDRLDYPQTQWNMFDALSNQLMSPSTRVYVSPNHLTFGDGEKVLRLYTTRLLPPHWHLGAMGNLIGDPFNNFLRLQGSFFLSYGVHVCNESTLKTKMLAKCGNVEKQAASPVAKYVPSLKKEAEEWGFVREKFEEGQRLVRTRFQVGLFSSPDQISREEQTLLNLYRSQRWELALDKYLQLPSFLSCLPMTWGEGASEDSRTFQKTKTTLSHEPSNLMPIQGEWQGTRSPGMMLAGRRGQLFYWSPFDNDEGNFNTIVVGRSGSGKSVFMQELMTSILGMGGRVFVIDVGRSFEKTAKLLNGTYIEFSTHSPICINPFSSILTNDSEAATDALAMLKPVISLMAAPKEGTKDIEDTYIEQALQEAWKTKQTHATITDVAKALLDHYDPVAKSLGERLYPYTEKGTYGRFFNGPSTIDLSDKLVVLEMEELKERKYLQAVIIQMINVNITNTIYLGDRKTPFALFFDEFHTTGDGKQAGALAENAARTFRKLQGSLILGTQSVNDFYTSVGAQAAFDNSDWMCLLSQKDESIKLLKNSDRLSMDPVMERTLRSLRTEQGKYAEIMIKGPKGFALGRLLLDSFSKILYSTKAQEFAAVQSLMAQGKSLKEAIQTLAAK